MKLTLDTNVLWDATDPTRGEEHHQNALRLLELHEQGVCHIFRTTRVKADAPHPPASARIENLPQISGPLIGTAFRLDISPLDSGDMLVNNDWIDLEGRLRSVIFPGTPEQGRKEGSRKSDLDHLLGHLHSGNDVFVTRDTHILRARNVLADEFRIIVMPPDEALRVLTGEESS